MSERAVQETLEMLWKSQHFGVLATHGEGQSYASLVAFAATPDRTALLVVTPRNTRKYANLRAHPHIAMLIDNRSNSPADVQEAVAVTVTGVCRDVPEQQRDEALRVYVARHPHLKDFVEGATSVLLRLEIDTCVVVDCFQRVVVWHPNS